MKKCFKDLSQSTDKGVSEPLLESANEILLAIAYAHKDFIEHPCRHIQLALRSISLVIFAIYSKLQGVIWSMYQNGPLATSLLLRTGKF